MMPRWLAAVPEIIDVEVRDDGWSVVCDSPQSGGASRSAETASAVASPAARSTTAAM
jgi:hypothetical protein